MKRTAEQNKILHKLISDLNINKELKMELVYEFTGGRETSSAEMGIDECASLISHLQEIHRQISGYNNLCLIKLRWRFYYTLRTKGYLPELKNEEAMSNLDNMCIKIWHKAASNMDKQELNRYIGIVNHWKNKQICQKSKIPA